MNKTFDSCEWKKFPHTHNNYEGVFWAKKAHLINPLYELYS